MSYWHAGIKWFALRWVRICLEGRSIIIVVHECLLQRNHHADMFYFGVRFERSLCYWGDTEIFEGVGGAWGTDDEIG